MEKSDMDMKVAYKDKMLDLGEVVLLMKDWAMIAGDIQLGHFRKSGLDIATKYNDYDVVTIADKESEKTILGYIRDFFPGHSILSEESGETEGNSPWRWVIDPLDGTTNYSQGLPVFSVSIALEYEGEAVAGVVYAPYLKEMFTAVKGEGAYLNGQKIGCSGKEELSRAVVATGMPVDKQENPDNNLANIANVVTKVRGLRRYGSAAIDLCYVAAGYLDAFWELALHRWDIAAGALIASEAGARVEFFRPDREYSIFASSPQLYPSFRPLIR